MNKEFVRICKIIIALSIIFLGVIVIYFVVAGDSLNKKDLSNLFLMIWIFCILNIVVFLLLTILEMRMKIKEKKYKAIVIFLGKILFIWGLLFLSKHYLNPEKVNLFECLLKATVINIGSEGFSYMRRKD
ncbi:MAG: hypothetical protein GX275_11400 [Clostridiales bacterium]|nr:hypothetical protein [Clostridiales bacterium]